MNSIDGFLKVQELCAALEHCATEPHKARDLGKSGQNCPASIRPNARNTANPRSVKTLNLSQDVKTKEFNSETFAQSRNISYNSLQKHSRAPLYLDLLREEHGGVVCVGLVPQRIVTPVTQSNMFKFAESVMLTQKPTLNMNPSSRRPFLVHETATGVGNASFPTVGCGCM